MQAVVATILGHGQRRIQIQQYCTISKLHAHKLFWVVFHLTQLRTQLLFWGHMTRNFENRYKIIYEFLLWRILLCQAYIQWKFSPFSSEEMKFKVKNQGLLRLENKQCWHVIKTCMHGCVMQCQGRLWFPMGTCDFEVSAKRKPLHRSFSNFAHLICRQDH